jgi:diguanylate cyclase (GGDEF)-like protein
MTTKLKLLLIVTLMLLALGVATIINISLNFRAYSIKGAVEKASTTAAIVKDGLTAHMVNGIMDKRQYFLNQISTNNDDVKKLWIIRSQKVIDQFGDGFNNETIRDTIDKKVLETGKLIKKVDETSEHITLRVTIPYKATINSNGTNCLSCHNVKHNDTLGAISMEFDITSMRNAGFLTISKILFINLIFIVIVLLLINYYVTPYMKMFSNMQNGITKAYRGDFSHQFDTSIKGDAKEIVSQMNTLFRKMEETFGNIKHNLATFIPQGAISSSDPLHDAKTIISELSDIYKFKKTIELDLKKESVYKRIIDVLTEKFHLKHFAFYEVRTTTEAVRTLIHITDGTSICNTEVDEDASKCRAFKTNTDVISTEFINLCETCNCKDTYYICIPFSINEEYSLVLSATAKTEDDITYINAKTPAIKNYLEAAKPVIEGRLLMAKLQDTSLRDAMTGLYNRRFLEEFIDNVMSQAVRDKDTYHVMMLDVDFFKSVNDNYGHDIGDKVITEIGKLLQDAIRDADLAIRYGGEEFLVMLRNASDEGALKVAQDIHSQFAQLSFDVGNGQHIKKTISIGLAKFPTDGETIWKTIKYADTALYVAKTTGRNKIVEYSEDMSENQDLR